MRYISAYLLAVRGGNANPQAEDIKNILSAAAVGADDERVDLVVNALKGKSSKDIEELIAAGSAKLATISGGVRAASSAAPAAGGAAPAADSKPAKKEEPKEESEIVWSLLTSAENVIKEAKCSLEEAKSCIEDDDDKSGFKKGKSANFDLPINGRIYQSPAPSQAHNESANTTFGGCFNSYNSSWAPSKNNGQSFTPMFQSTPKQAGGPFKHSSWRNATPSSTPRRQNGDLGSVRLRLIDLELNNATTSYLNTSHNRSLRSTLPVWAIDENGGVSESVTLKDVLVNEALIEFATDKNGCRLLQEQYPEHSDGGIHDDIFRRMVEDRNMFLSMCRNMFGNFFVQRMVECSNNEKQKLEVHLASRLAADLRDSDLVRLSIDQNGNHVVQKIIKTPPVSAWDFVVKFFCNAENLCCFAKTNPHLECYSQRLHLLENLMVGVTRNCGQLASNEFANYVVQHVVKCGGAMETFRDVIIEQCLLRNLLSMSQENYASHVAEIAFLRAPHRLAFEMMEEIFEGYIPHPETNRDALGILLFHQYGNYDIQQMINICCNAILGRSDRHLEKKEI